MTFTAASKRTKLYREVRSALVRLFDSLLSALVYKGVTQGQEKQPLKFIVIYFHLADGSDSVEKHLVGH